MYTRGRRHPGAASPSRLVTEGIGEIGFALPWSTEISLRLGQANKRMRGICSVVHAYVKYAQYVFFILYSINHDRVRFG